MAALVAIYSNEKKIGGLKQQQIWLPACDCHVPSQQAKKVVSDSPGLVDFATRLVIFVLNLPNRVLFFRQIQITEGL